MNQGTTWASSPRSTIWCIQNDFWAYGTFGANRAPILRQDYTISKMDRNELPLEPRHLGVPSGATKRISKSMVRLAPTVHLSYTNTNSLQTDRNLIPHDPHHLGVPFGASKTNFEPMVCSTQTMHLSPSNTKLASTWASSRTSTIRCVQNDFWAYGTFGANHAPILHWH